jgi:hypothetical protein
MTNKGFFMVGLILLFVASIVAAVALGVSHAR